MMRLISTVFRKELRDHVRDRRSMTSALLFPLFGPLLFAAMFNVLASWSRSDKPLELAVVGRQNAPNLVQFLERAGAAVKDAPADFRKKVADGDLDVVLVIPEAYGADFEAGRQAKLEVVLDNSRNQARMSIRRTQRLLDAYDRQIGVLRLLARGVSPELAHPLDIDEVDLATSEKMAANVLNMIPMFLLMAAFMGGMYLAIDTTAGERERGSLEPLMVTPVDRSAIVLGKFGATVMATWTAVLITLFGFTIAIGKVPLEDLGIRAQLGATQLIGILMVVLPLSLLAASLQMLIATFARSFKEAQSYVQIMVLVPIIPSVFLSLTPVKQQWWMMLVPFLSQDRLISNVMRGEGLDLAWLLISVLATVTAALACIAATVRLLGKERIIFGR